jgi:hypothetical protein
MPNNSAMAGILGGLFAGLVWNLFFTRFLRLLLAGIGKPINEGAPFVPKREPWAIPLLLLNPAPWLLLIVLWLAYAAYSGGVPPVWGWFVASFFGSVLMSWATTYMAVRRALKKRRHLDGA